MTSKEQKRLNKLGKRIEELYIKKHGSLNQFSIVSEVDNRSLRRIIRGEVNPRLNTLIKISDSLDLTISELLKDL